MARVSVSSYHTLYEWPSSLEPSSSEYCSSIPRSGGQQRCFVFSQLYLQWISLTARDRPVTVAAASVPTACYACCSWSLPGAPNPRVVDMYAAEKGALDYLYSIQYVCDLAGMENRGPEAQKLNPSGGVPWIEFDDGTAVAETVAICELLEEVGTGRSLLGESMKERATVRMWQRRVEQQIILPSFDAYRWSVFRCYLRTTRAGSPEPLLVVSIPMSAAISGLAMHYHQSIGVRSLWQGTSS